GAVSLLTQAIDWPDTGRPRRAAVSSFGISGTNAHLILEAAPTPDPDTHTDADSTPTPLPYLLSAKTEDALHAQARRLHQHLSRQRELRPVDVAHSLATGRAQLEHRAALVAGDRGELLAGLAALGAGDTGGAALLGEAAKGRTAFVFPGQGSQWPGMAGELLRTSPRFAEHIEACAAALARYADWSLMDVLRDPEAAAPLLQRVDVVQPALFAVMVSLTEAWGAFGVRPDAVVGHSQGEIAAAYVAGALSLEDATAVVALRSHALTELGGTGTMASVPLPAETVAADLAAYEGLASVAAVNGPGSTVIAGDTATLGRIVAAYQEKGVRARGIPVDYASHSPHVERIRERVLDALAHIAPRPSSIPLYSTLTGDVLDTTAMDAGYWYTNLRQPVRYEQAVRALRRAGHRLFVESSPHPVLTIGTQETLDDSPGGGALAVGTLRRDDGGMPRLLASVAQAHVSGTAVVDWSPAFAGLAPAWVDLPTYAFQRERYWIDTPPGGSDVTSAGLDVADHPFLTAEVVLPDGGGTVFTGRLALAEQPWLGDHSVFDTAVVPPAALVELALYAGARTGCAVLDELAADAPLVLPESGGLQVRVAVGPRDEAAARTVTVHTRAEQDADEDGWTRHATGRLVEEPADGAAPAAPPSLASWPPPGAAPVDVSTTYERLAAAGLAHGPVFQGLRALWQDGTDLYAEADLPDDAADARFLVHPALLDAALHAVALGDDAAGATGPAGEAPRWLTAGSGVTLHAAAPGAAVRVRLRATGPGRYALDVADATGAPVLTAAGVTLSAVDQRRLASGSGPRDALFAVEWPAVPEPEVVLPDWALIGDAGALPAPGFDGSVRHADLAALGEALDAGLPAPRWVVAACPQDTGDDPAARAHAVARDVLGLARQWLGDDRFASCTLVLLTHGAVAAGDADPVRDPGAAAAWGLLRSAQSESPGRFRLIDLDDDSFSAAALPAALAADAPQLAVRTGTLHSPRLASLAAAAPEGERPPVLDPEGTVLITGGTGALGALLARHLVTAYGVRH
ncbi:MAG: acyltransferase domain-containing protein, partial [Actinomycetia bacterium]|nr:acyltransferase domain-containing protein [Actinomycetes bacterium]